MKWISDKLLKNEEGKVFFQYYSSITAMLAITSCGIHYGWPSPSLPKLLQEDSEIPITEDEGYWLATMTLFGAILGCVLAARLTDSLGRRTTIILTSIPFLISGIMIVFSSNVEMLYTARFIAGIADGLSFLSVPMYIGEITQPNARGMLASGVSVSFIFGILAANAVGSYLSIKMAALLFCILPVTLLVTFVWMPESPYYLIMKNRPEEARASLNLFIGPKMSESEFPRIQQAIEDDSSRKKSNIFDLFTVKSNRKAFLVMMLVRGSQQLSGFSATVFYAQNIFDEAGSELSAEVASMIYFSLQLVVTVLSAWLVDKTGRRPLLLFSVIGACLSLLAEGLYFYFKSLGTVNLSDYSIVPVLALLWYIVFFSIGLQNIPILMLSEIFGQDVKASALCFADMYFSFLASSTSKFFQVTRDSFGMHVPFLCFCGFCGVSSVLIYVFVPETKGRNLEEIQDHFKGKKKLSGNGKEVGIRNRVV